MSGFGQTFLSGHVLHIQCLQGKKKICISSEACKGGLSRAQHISRFEWAKPELANSCYLTHLSLCKAELSSEGGIRGGNHEFPSYAGLLYTTTVSNTWPSVLFHSTVILQRLHLNKNLPPVNLCSWPSVFSHTTNTTVLLFITELFLRKPILLKACIASALWYECKQSCCNI